MQTYFHHIGSPGNSDLDLTVRQKRSLAEMLTKLPIESNERVHYTKGGVVANAFQDGQFNCWGVPDGAAKVFDRMKVGDVLLLIPSIGVNGAIEYLGVVRAKTTECWDSSRILWHRDTTRLFPRLVFFDAEGGSRSWEGFLDDVDYKHTYDPRGKLWSVLESRLGKWGGSIGYLSVLRSRWGFKPLN